jgi:hypothetical protein
MLQASYLFLVTERSGFWGFRQWLNIVKMLFLVGRVVTNNRIWVVLIASASAVLVAYIAIGSAPNSRLTINDNDTLATTPPQLGSLTIITLNEGRLSSGAIYRIAPDPFTRGGNYTIHDGDLGEDASLVDGIITIEGMSDGTFSVIQLAGADGQLRDIIPRVVTVTNSSSESVTFGVSVINSQGTSGNDFDDIESILYAAKFECGTISGNEGPLRPGHYDTDIGIFNKQSFAVRVTWSAAASDDETTNALLKTLTPQVSTNIVCKDIRSVIGEEPEFVEGFVLIEVPVDPRLLSSISGGSTVLSSNQQDQFDVLDVQTFYTANALDELPHSVLVDKISFVIHANSTIGSLPDSIIDTILDVTVPSEMGEVSDPEEKVKSHLSMQYNMTSEEMSRVVIEIRSVDIGVGTMIDDHAISLSKVRPQIKRG